MTVRWTPEQFEAHERRQLADRLKRKAAKPKTESANAITRNVLRVVNSQPGCVAYRINNVGVWDAAKGVFRKGNTEKGIFDISATVRGRAAWIEVKAGRDKMSREQLIFKAEQERAGALCCVAHSTDEFLNWFTEFLKQ